MLLPAIKSPNRNIILYYFHVFLYGLWFFEGVWFFFMGKFASYETIGIVFSLSTLVWILAEIPSGVFADRFGRKQSIIIGNILIVIASFMYMTAQVFWFIAIGLMISAVGRAFISGSLEALVYDGLLEKKEEYKYDKIVARGLQLIIIAFAVGPVIGGLLYKYNIYLPYVLNFIAMILALITSLWLIEPKKKTLLSNSSDNPNLAGFYELIQSGFRPFLLPIIVAGTMFGLYDWGLSKPAIANEAGLDATNFSIMISIVAVVAFFSAGLVPKFRERFSDVSLLIVAAILISGGFILGGLKIPLLGIMALFIVDIGFTIFSPVTSILVNKHVSSEYRATSISTLQFLYKIPFLVLNILAGFAITSGNINLFHLTIGLLSCFGLLMFALRRKAFSLSTSS